MKSILHDKDGTCYLCTKLHDFYESWNYTEEHHVFPNNPNRQLSERYGLKVHLCRWHHREGPEAVHNNSKNMDLLKMDAQVKFEETHTRQEFVSIFGRNWLDDDPMEEGMADAEEHRRMEDAAGRKERARQREAGFEFLSEKDMLDGMGGKYMEIDKAAASRKLNEEQFKNLLEIAETLGQEEPR